jgi:hypothetical protein
MNGKKERTTDSAGEVTWGPKLFAGAFVAVLVFFWWLLIYSHGVTPHH